MCRQMGYADGSPETMSHFGDGDGPIWLDDVDCVGSETRLNDCPRKNWGDENCSDGEAAGAVCSNQ